jgi:hypothetical protein
MFIWVWVIHKTQDPEAPDDVEALLMVDLPSRAKGNSFEEGIDK